MNYEKAYKEALERAKNLRKDAIDMGENIRAKLCEIIFPELQESEDERIRKRIIHALHGDVLDMEETNKAIAWLKKQGEQKTADKVEPKFKVGDWISGYYTNYKVTAINSKGYVVEGTDGNKINILFENEKFHHLFTIADAKNGDVLCDCHEAYDNPLIFILKKFEHVDFGLVRPSDYSSYCYLTAGDIQRFKEGTYHHEHNIKPATKEQRDLLFQKMKEAGYEWDAEKKELKKIEEGKASFANRQLYNRAILTILSNYVEKYPDIRFGQMLFNLDIKPHFDEESKETYCNLNETINKKS